MARFGEDLAFGEVPLPTANAGSNQQQAGVGLVTLDGSGSANYDSLAWTMVKLTTAGSADATSLLSSTTVAGPTFTPDAAGDTYVATLTATRGSNTDVSCVVIYIDPAAAGASWVAVDLSTATKTDANGIEGASVSLGTTSTIDLNNVHGRIDGTMDALFYTLPITGFDRTKHWGVAVRAKWTNTLAGGWEIYLGAGNDAAPVADQGYYFGTQLDSSAFPFGGAYGAAPINAQSVTDARYVAGVISYRSDRQDGTLAQVADSARTSRGGATRVTNPANAMSADDQYLLVGFGNSTAAGAEALTGLQVEYLLLEHLGL